MQRWASERRRSVIALVGVVIFISLYALLVRPLPRGREIPGLNYWPDSPDYIYGAVALLHGHYVIVWDRVLPIASGFEWGLTPHVPRYPPGMSLLLLPAVALGGVTSAAWVPYGAALLLGVLAAWLAARLGGLAAAPLAVVAVLGTGGAIALGQSVMSDIPSAALALLTVLLLMVGGNSTDVLAGMLTGALVWIRPMNAVLLVAGLVSLTAWPNWRRRSMLYLAGAVPLLFLLMSWQAVMFGSPFIVSYQAAGASPGGGHDLGSFFALQYVLGSPASTSNEIITWRLPSILYYPLASFGIDGFLSIPGLGLLGLVTLLRSTRQAGVQGLMSRFGVTALVGTFVTYLPYYHQDPRFFIVPAVFCNITAAVALARRGQALHGVLWRK